MLALSLPPGICGKSPMSLRPSLYLMEGYFQYPIDSSDISNHWEARPEPTTPEKSTARVERQRRMHLKCFRVNKVLNFLRNAGIIVTAPSGIILCSKALSTPKHGHQHIYAHVWVLKPYLNSISEDKSISAATKITQTLNILEFSTLTWCYKLSS